jgi:hypothetical protein
VLNGKRLSRAPHSRHDFVSNQEDTVLAANFSNTRHVTIRWNCGSKSRAYNWLEDKCSCVVLFTSVQVRLQIVSARKLALRESFLERAVTAGAWGNVAPIGDEWFIRRAASDIAADGHRPKRAAVIALAPRENAVAILLASFEVILTDQLDSSLGRFGAAGSEIHTAAIAKIRWSNRKETSGKFLSLSRMKLRGMCKGNLRGLLDHGATDFRNAVADVDDGSLPGSIQETPALLVYDPASFAANGKGKCFFEIAGEEAAVRRHELPDKGL